MLLFFYSVNSFHSGFRCCCFSFGIVQWHVFQYPFQRRVVKAVHFLRETAREVIEVRKNVINNGDEVPDDILHINQQQGKLLPLQPVTYLSSGQVSLRAFTEHPVLLSPVALSTRILTSLRLFLYCTPPVDFGGLLLFLPLGTKATVMLQSLI